MQRGGEVQIWSPPDQTRPQGSTTPAPIFLAASSYDPVGEHLVSGTDVDGGIS